MIPLLVTQLNCRDACGLEPRKFLELVRERRIAHRRIGKTIAVKPDDLLAALEHEPENASTTTETAEARLTRAAGLTP